MNLTFGKFHCRTFPENIDGLITLTTAEYRSFFIICQAGSNDNPHDELELTLRHFDRGYKSNDVYTTSNEAVNMALWGDDHGYLRFVFYIVYEVTEKRGFKIRAVPLPHSNTENVRSINDTISLDIITFTGANQGIISEVHTHYY